MSEIGRPKKVVKDEISVQCVCCSTIKREDEFFVNKFSSVFNAYDKRVPVCKSCLQNMYDALAEKYDDQTALKLVCSVLNMPYSVEAYANASKGYDALNIGIYVRQMQLQSHKNKTFLNSLLDGSISKSETVKEIIDTEWTSKDKQNMNYCVTTFGYDPFEDCGLSNNDRKYCFNILSTYCDIPGIKDDGHKMQACIQICLSQLQVRKIDEMLNNELDEMGSDDDRIRVLAASKKQLQDIIGKLAQDNNISSKYNTNSKRGKDTLSQKEKEMFEAGYEPVRPNLFDIKTSESFEQVMKISLKCMAEQLAFDDADCAEIIKNQRESNVKLRQKAEELEEENRNLKNELNDLKFKYDKGE